MDLLSSLQHDRQLMLTAVKEARERGVKLAHAEAEYQTAKHIRALQMKDEGMPSTMVALTIKGDPRVCEAMFKRDCAQVEYDSAREAINSYKLSARLTENQIQREWNQAGGQV